MRLTDIYFVLKLPHMSHFTIPITPRDFLLCTVVRIKMLVSRFVPSLFMCILVTLFNRFLVPVHVDWPGRRKPYTETFSLAQWR